MATASTIRVPGKRPLPIGAWVDDCKDWRPLTTLAQIEKEFRDLEPTEWVFRGQHNAHWEPESSLVRGFIANGVDGSERLAYERAMVKEFTRYYHLYASFVPPREDVLTYLTLMQHFGTPTRLLDWTYSINVALFFAVESLRPNGRDAGAVYAINRRELNSRCQKLLAKHGINDPFNHDRYFESATTFDSLFRRRSAHMFLYRLNSYYLNERSAIQQGLFLCQSTLSRSFMEHLHAMFPGLQYQHVRKYVIRPTAQSYRDIMRRLHHMNINAATLFPGLPGFAASLKSLLWMPERVYPEDKRHP